MYSEQQINILEISVEKKNYQRDNDLVILDVSRSVGKVKKTNLPPAQLLSLIYHAGVLYFEIKRIVVLDNYF